MPRFVILHVNAQPVIIDIDAVEMIQNDIQAGSGTLLTFSTFPQHVDEPLQTFLQWQSTGLI